MGIKRKTTDGVDSLECSQIKIGRTKLTSNATTQREVLLPDAAGTVALTTDIPGSGSFVTIDTTQSVTGAKTFSNALVVSNTTDSTSTTTGSIRTAGGIGIEKNAYVGGSVYIPNGSAAAPAIRFTNDTNTGFFRISEDNVGVSVGGSTNARFNSTETLFGNVDVRLTGSGIFTRFDNVNYNPNGNAGTSRVGSIISTSEFGRVTDTDTATNATVANRFDHGFLYKDCRTTNTGITYTNSSTVYINSRPAHTGNTAIHTYGLLLNSSANIGISGVVGRPGLGFFEDTSTGIYKIANGNMGWAITGARAMDLTSSRLSLASGCNLAMERSGFSNTISCPTLTANRSTTLPDSAGELLTTTSTATVTNKTIVTPSLAVGTTGTVVTRKLTATVSVSSVPIAAGTTVVEAITFASAFASVPRVYALINFLSGGGFWDYAVVVVGEVTTTGCNVYIRNSNTFSSITGNADIVYIAEV